MHDLDLLVPSALVDPGLADDLLHGVAMPHLDAMATRGQGATSHPLPGDAPLASWQAWVFGGRGGPAADWDRINVAELWAMACGLAPAVGGGRWVVEPAHFKIANDHLRLDDPRELSITLAEARALADSIEPVLADAGWQLHPVEASTLTHWPVARSDGVRLVAPAIDRAIHDNVAAWQPRMATVATTGTPPATDPALDWRRCVNEIQMLWFGHPVNEAREARGQPTVNTLWLSGNGAPRGEMPHYASVDSDLALLAALPFEPDAPRVLESFDALVAPMRAEDWSGWRDALGALDARLGAVAAQQAAGTLGTVTVVLCGAHGAKALTAGARDLGRPWRGWFRKASPLAGLLADLDAVAPAPSA